MSSHGWYPSSMTLNSLNSLSSSQLVDRGPKFITTFHFPLPAYLIYDSINNNHCRRMPCHPQCPSCPLPACVDYHQLFSPLKLYLLISLSGPVTLFLRVMPRGEAKSDLAIPPQSCKLPLPSDLSFISLSKIGPKQSVFLQAIQEV